MPDIDQAETQSDQPKKTNKYSLKAAVALYNATPIGLRRIAKGTAVAVVVLIVVTFLHPHLPKTVFLTGTLLDLLIIVAVIVQAYIYVGQWDVMKRQASEMEKQAGLMEQTIGEARISREVENRAYVTVTSVTLQAPFIEAVREGAVNVEARFTNAGKTPALNVTLTSVHSFSDMAHNVDFESRPWEVQPGTQSSFVVLPGEPHFAFRELGLEFNVREVLPDKREVAITLPREVQQGLSEQSVRRKFESERLYVYGRVLYEDVFGQQRESTYCFFVPNLHDLKLHYCTNPKHNRVK